MQKWVPPVVLVVILLVVGALAFSLMPETKPSGIKVDAYGYDEKKVVPTTPAPEPTLTPTPIPSSEPTSPVDMSDTSPMWSAPSILPTTEIQGKIARVQTSKGEIVIELFAETAPLTVSNFVYLANRGYFDGLTFHRRVEEFVIQGGDPSGNGTGGPGYKFADELKDSYAYDRGIVAMANAGPNTNGSQFFIMLADVPLPKSYSIFGRVLSGMEAVDAIKVGDKMTKITIEQK